MICFLHFLLDEICTTADCTQSGKYSVCLFVCLFGHSLYCLTLKALNSLRGGRDGKIER